MAFSVMDTSALESGSHGYLPPDVLARLQPAHVAHRAFDYREGVVPDGRVVEVRLRRLAEPQLEGERCTSIMGRRHAVGVGGQRVRILRVVGHVPSAKGGRSVACQVLQLAHRLLRGHGVVHCHGVPRLHRRHQGKGHRRTRHRHGVQGPGRPVDGNGEGARGRRHVRVQLLVVVEGEGGAVHRGRLELRALLIVKRRHENYPGPVVLDGRSQPVGYVLDGAAVQGQGVRVDQQGIVCPVRFGERVAEHQLVRPAAAQVRGLPRRRPAQQDRQRRDAAGGFHLHRPVEGEGDRHGLPCAPGVVRARVVEGGLADYGCGLGLLQVIDGKVG